MYVRNGFTIEIHGFMHSLCTFWHVLLRMPSRNGMEIEVEDSEDRRQRQNKSRCSYGRWLTAQQKDERQQDNGDRKRLACHHPSDLLHSLTRERIDGGQHFELHHFRTFHVLRMRHVYTSLAAQTLTQDERVWSISHVSNTPRISWRVNWVSDEWRRGRLPFLARCLESEA